MSVPSCPCCWVRVQATVKLQRVEKSTRVAKLMSAHLSDTSAAGSLPQQPPTRTPTAHAPGSSHSVRGALADQTRGGVFTVFYHPDGTLRRPECRRWLQRDLDRDDGLITCPFNQGHRMPVATLRSHIAACGDAPSSSGPRDGTTPQ